MILLLGLIEPVQGGYWKVQATVHAVGLSKIQLLNTGIVNFEF